MKEPRHEARGPIDDLCFAAEDLAGTAPRSSDKLKPNKPLATKMQSKNQKDPFDNDLALSEEPNHPRTEANENQIEVEMDFGDEEDDIVDKEEEEERENMESAENMDIISELQMKQQEIAMKKDGLLSTEQS